MKKTPQKKKKPRRGKKSSPDFSLVFRVWDRTAASFVAPDESIALLEKPSPALLSHSAPPIWVFPSSPPPVPASRYAVTQWTGLLDKNSSMVFEGDIVEFVYRVGDMAWQEMDEEEKRVQEKMVGKKFIGVVEREPRGANMQLSVKFEKGLVEAYFPLVYANGVSAEVVGNVFENVRL